MDSSLPLRDEGLAEPFTRSLAALWALAWQSAGRSDLHFDGCLSGYPRLSPVAIRRDSSGYEGQSRGESGPRREEERRFEKGAVT